MKFRITNVFGFLLIGLTILACKEKGASSPPFSVGVAEAGQSLPGKVDLSGHRMAHDFIVNRVHAIYHHQGSMILDAGDVSFYKFVDGNWKGSWSLREKDGGQRVANVAGLSAAFSFPVDTDGDGVLTNPSAAVQLTLHLRALTPSQRLSVFLNEKAVGTLEVSQERAAYSLVLPASGLHPGENRIRLTFRSVASLPGGKRSAAVFYGAEIGAPRPGATALPSLPRVAEVDLGGVRKRAFEAQGPSRLSFYVQVPPQGQLALSLGSRQPGARALIRITRDGEAPKTLWEGEVPPSFVDGGWNLGHWANQAVRIDLISKAGPVIWANPRFMVKAPPKVAKAKVTFDRIYVWMIDTLRADKVRAYNPKTNVETPNYDAFAGDATRFVWAQVPGTWSLPSQASMLTGVYPTVHKAVSHESKISLAVPFLPEILKKAGFRTALFSSNGYVSSKWGFGRGWDENRNLIRESLPNGADALWGMAKKWILADARKPQFVYLAVIEPHVIYNPKKEYLQKYWNKPYQGPIKPTMTGIQLGKIKQGKLKVNDTDKAYLEALHNAEITQSDTAFGVFIADLKAAGLYDRSAIVVISDHGDEFWDHGDVGHAQAPHQELVRVPFIVRAPGLLPKGQVVNSDVEAMDLMPTLLDLAGEPIPEIVQGRSILDVALDEVAYSPASSLTQTGDMGRGFKSGRYRFNHQGVAKMSLFDDLDDPREQHDLADKRPIALRHMRSLFALRVGLENQWKKRSWGTSASLTEAFYQDVNK